MSRIVMNEAREDRLYAVIHDTIMVARIKVLKAGHVTTCSGVDDILHDLVEPVFSRVLEELTANIPESADV